MLALAEVHETWDCEDAWDEPRYGRRRSWARDDDDEWYEDDDPPPPDDPDAYRLVDLLDWSITLDRWIDPSGKETEPIVTDVRGAEVCYTTPSSDLEPYAAEHEGYMGNYGNTMDRWYRRAAIVLWPRERGFAVRAEASPAWALKVLRQRIRAGKVPEAREMAASLLPFWDAVARREEQRHFFTQALRVAEGLERPALAASLLRPFRVEALSPGRAPAFVALVKRYGVSWTQSLLAEWSGSHRPWMRLDSRDRLRWLTSLPRLCEALRAADEAVGTLAAHLLLDDRWGELKEAIEGSRGLAPPSRQDEALAALARPLLSFLESTAVVMAGGQRDEAVTYLCADEKEPLLPCLVQMLRAAGKAVAPAKHTAMGLDAIGRHCTRLLEAKLEQPTRDEGDWSITLPEGCGCELCARLAEFLSDPEERRLEWPLAKERRKHVHGRLDEHELPVRHETRRSGSPYTLVLSKTKALFERAARERRSWLADFEWLTALTNADRQQRLGVTI